MFFHPFNFSLSLSLNLKIAFPSFSWVLHRYPAHQSLPVVWNPSFTFSVMIGDTYICLFAGYFCMSHVFCSSVPPLLPFLYQTKFLVSPLILLLIL